jgi:hypothetical protein
MTEVLTLSYGYTAKDLAAVRAYVQRVAPAIIARTYYDPDEDAFAATPSAMERHLLYPGASRPRGRARVSE